MNIIAMSEIGAAEPAGLGLEPVILLERNAERDVGLAALDLGDPRARVGDELDGDAAKSGRRAPVLVERPQLDVGAGDELLDQVSPRPDRLLLEAGGADLLVVLLRDRIAGEEGHPLEQIGDVLLDVAGNVVAFGLEASDARPDDRADRVACLRVGGAVQVPDDVLRRHGCAVAPEGAAAHFHLALGLVGVPAPLGEQAGLERRVVVLVDELVEDAFPERLQRRVHRRRAARRVPAGQGDVVGEDERVGRLAKRERREKRGERAYGGNSAGSEHSSTGQRLHSRSRRLLQATAQVYW